MNIQERAASLLCQWLNKQGQPPFFDEYWDAAHANDWDGLDHRCKAGPYADSVRRISSVDVTNITAPQGSIYEIMKHAYDKLNPTNLPDISWKEFTEEEMHKPNEILQEITMMEKPMTATEVMERRVIIRNALNRSFQPLSSHIATGDGQSTEFQIEDKPTYPFETYIRPYDGVEVHAVTGIPADQYVEIDSVRDTI